MNTSYWRGGQTLGGMPLDGASPLTLSKPIQLNFGLGSFIPGADASGVGTPLPNFKVDIGNESEFTAPFTEATQAPSNSWWQNSGILGHTDNKGNRFDGWGGMALGAANGVFNAYMGLKQYGLFKDQLNFQKEAFNKNWAAQANMTNAALEAKQQDIYNANPSGYAAATGYQSVGDYMAKHKVT